MPMPDGDAEAAGPPAYGPPVYKPAPPPPAYKPAPAPYKPAPHPVEKLPPQPYQYEYGVADQYTGTNFQSVESQNAEGTVVGKWRSYCRLGPNLSLGHNLCNYMVKEEKTQTTKQ